MLAAPPKYPPASPEVAGCDHQPGSMAASEVSPGRLHRACSSEQDPPITHRGRAWAQCSARAL